MTKFPKTQEGIPFNDRLVFLHIIKPRATNKGIHNQNTLRIRNNGVNSLTVSQLKFSNPTEFAIVLAGSLQIYPNPFTSSVDISISPDIDTEVKLLLTDLSGRILVEQTIPVEKVGDIVSWELSGLGLPRGMYMVRLQSGTRVLSVSRLMRE